MACHQSGYAASPASQMVIVIPMPLQGHITPLLLLAKLIAAHGFAVTFVLRECQLTDILKRQQGHSAITRLFHQGVRVVGIPDGSADEAEGDRNLIPSMPWLQEPFDDLVKKTVQEHEIEIACILSDSFLVWTQDIANKWNIPRVCFWPQSLATFACSISLPKITEASPDLDPFDDTSFHNSPPGRNRIEACRALHCVPGLSGIDASSLPFRSPNKFAAVWLREQLHKQMERINESACLVINTIADLKQMHRPISKSFLSQGVDTGLSLADEDETCLQWLNLHQPRSVLYISLGSLITIETQSALEIAMALEACNVPFLWVLRSSDTHTGLPLRDSHLGKIVQWTSQLKVLSHEAIGGFLTHCGWNSVLESISHGVPIIAWPHVMDQITNCWYQVEKWRAGVRLEGGSNGGVARLSVEKAVRLLMQENEGKEMRARASSLSLLASSSMKTLSGTLDSLLISLASFKLA
ncbi:hypothetical protein KP509_38G051900 [Ceratopteris richardii]|uniref:Glycosyltransferase n=1 Tax=Ceratopteris richardii TaxID=49495 RepID=A0A8T2Q510_CERRI|nr:hypothetical protein KP509_38G051900 [Ceratopteris richardii]